MNQRAWCPPQQRSTSIGTDGGSREKWRKVVKAEIDKGSGEKELEKAKRKEMREIEKEREKLKEKQKHVTHVGGIEKAEYLKFGVVAVIICSF